jgi:hypothetical protein
MAVSGIRREVAALMIARGLPIPQVSKETKISERTLYRWLAEDEAFQRRVEELGEELRSQLFGRVSDGALRGADTLVELLDSDDDRVRLQAARCLLAAQAGMRNVGKLAEQVASVEQTLLARGQS